MKLLVLFAVLVVVVVYIVPAVRQRMAPPALPATVLVTDAPRVLEQLRASGSDGSFAAFLFDAPGAASEEPAVNLQFSIENGRPGLDWVLLAPANVRDQARFSRLVEERGYRAEQREMNNVLYLRVEQGNLAELAVSVMQDLYGLSDTAPVELLVEGFNWRPGS